MLGNYFPLLSLNFAFLPDFHVNVSTGLYQSRKGLPLAINVRSLAHEPDAS